MGTKTLPDGSVIYTTMTPAELNDAATEGLARLIKTMEAQVDTLDLRDEDIAMPSIDTTGEVKP